MCADSNHFISDPYTKFFPLGTFIALIGGGIWIFADNEYYPLIFHSQIMVGAFLFSFISGFLMTAIPKMTDSFSAKKFEVYTMLFLITVGVIFSFFGFNQYFYLSRVLSFLLLIYFGFSRINFNKKSPPPFFILVFIGIIAGIFGAIFLGLGILISIGHNLYFNGTVLFLILGIGSRLIPALRGIAPPIMAGGSKKEYLEFGLAGIFIFIALIGEALGNALVFGLVKTFICFLIAIRYWKIFSLNVPTSRLAYGMLGSSFMVLIGIFLKVLIPAFGIHLIHLTYIGGFGMMTFTVASRVIISHGGYDMSFEKKSLTPLVVAALLLVSALIRVAAPYFDYLEMLKWASAFWICGALVWSYVFIPRCVGLVSKD